MTAPHHDITALLAAHREGDREALRELVPLVYADLRRLARRQLGGRGPGETLDTTGLVHEAYLKLVDQSRAAWADRGHFFAVAALAMRHIVVDHARRACARKRGGEHHPVPLEEALGAVSQQAETVVAVEEALARLGELDERLVRIVECRFFAGLTAEETADALGISTRTVERDWRRARAWLRHDLGAGAGSQGVP